MKFLAIDYGQKRIGLAISDESETFALPFDTLEHKNNKSGTTRSITKLLQLIHREEVAALVLGLPRSADGSAGEMEVETRAFAAELTAALSSAKPALELVWWDERFSTASVLKNLRAAGVSQKSARAASGKESIDARAAAVILQDFLDARKLAASRNAGQRDESEDAF